LAALALLLALGVAGAACGPGPGPDPDPDTLPDSAERFLDDTSYRRAILERDLLATDNVYAQRRLSWYAIEGQGWDILPERDLRSRPLDSDDAARLQAGMSIELRAEGMTTLLPTTLPETDAQWQALGRRVMMEYPLRVDPMYATLAGIPGALADVGFIEEDGQWLGLRVFEAEDGAARVSPACSQCHFSTDSSGSASPVLANKSMDIGRAFLLSLGQDPDLPIPEDEDSPMADLHRLGPGRVDLLLDDVFNPYAIPDMGGIVDQPYLQQNANWYHRGTVTLAMRCDTLFITAGSERFRIPRALSWAVAAYLRSLPPPSPLEPEPSAQSEAGELLFEEQACNSCHSPPTFTSEMLVSLDTVGTDPAAGESFVRVTGYYRIPSLRGVGRTAPYLHHGGIENLELFFDPQREEPGHPWGLDLDPDEREQLIAFLRSI
jgi:mono/diheme cytochrome c family protein